MDDEYAHLELDLLSKHVETETKTQLWKNEDEEDVEDDCSKKSYSCEIVEPPIGKHYHSSLMVQK